MEKDYRERKRQRRRSSSEKVNQQNKMDKLNCINKATNDCVPFFKSLTQTRQTPPAIHQEESTEYEVIKQLYQDIIDYKDPDE